MYTKAQHIFMYMFVNAHTIAGRSGICPGKPLSISALVPRKTKLMVAKVHGFPYSRN